MDDLIARLGSVAQEQLARVVSSLPAFIDRKTIAAETGLTRAAIDAVFRAVPVVKIPGCRKVFAKREDVQARSTATPSAATGCARGFSPVSSVHIRRIVLASGSVRHRVRYRLGGRETEHRHGGSFRTRRQAEARTVDRGRAGGNARARPARRGARAGERAPGGRAVAPLAPGLSPATLNVHRKSLAHVLDAFGDRAPESLSIPEVDEWVGILAGPSRARGPSRRSSAPPRWSSITHGVSPNPFRIGG